ncbi:phenolic acid decarboxylase [Mycobacteroides abscessus]|uniref:Phenolic acid decarboxylase n=1 Tax=Mycobacteroides abscessus TaxID=36809 RepID=A0ABD7HIP0_9MYCO|nr:phenolic acid decarboxylase [Mycobacteroides abscessus]AWG62834.1 phenolic acid decarboxylase [Mycobacteroides abscessus]PVA73711.1 phenolic acid decarboxylase [Mycobacteroides abscessus]PVB11950.1 phenolic acid decarboxylase [Mycobacteroides abscessus]PVB16643.1 phenolic acid decarboxylase [Mycobacteroides abscessus]RIR41892.1 phenolic acid decarboxylase [Mycobacteroides abscessus]
MPTTVENPAPEQDLEPVLGHRFIYTYANGWQYEIYFKNPDTIDYRIHRGMVGGRWVKGQQVDLVQITAGVFKVSWSEPTGTTVSLNIVPAERVLHGVIFFPRWVEDAPRKTVLFQNDHLDQMRTYRDTGPTYPTYVVPEFAKITFCEYVGEDDDEAISIAPSDLPVGWSDRTN